MFLFSWVLGMSLGVVILLLGLTIFFRSEWLIWLISPLICPEAIFAVTPKNANNRGPKKMVALTIDDGPDGGDSTQKILDVLREQQASATFF